MRNILAATIALLLTCTSAAGGQTSPQPALWFHPEPSRFDLAGQPTDDGGSWDFAKLFRANAPWQRALSSTSVIGIYPVWVLQATPLKLEQAIAFLNSRGLGIELETPALQATSTCGTGVEGYIPYGASLQTITLTYLNRLKSLGANVAFVKVDEPYFFGSVTPDPRSCHSTVEQIATQVSQFTALVHSVYPNAQVGDVEPIITSLYAPDVEHAIARWHATYQQVNGSPFPFFVADLDFGNPGWPTLARRMEYDTKQSGMRFGIIYIGDYQDTSDAEWVGKVEARFTAYQGRFGGRPDFVLFQSWEQHPRYCLPETNPATFTGALDAYLNFVSLLRR